MIDKLMSMEDAINLVQDGPDGWSRWYTPRRDIINSCFTIANMNLGEKAAGDTYSCQIEIEFSGVEATEGKEFKFYTQGATDGVWTIGNVWNYEMVWLEIAPPTYIADVFARPSVPDGDRKSVV